MNVKAFSLALGVTWAFAVLLLGLSSTFFSWGVEWVEFIAFVYRGYAPTIVGSIIGAVWAFVDGAIGGVIFAWLYNKFSK